jgi:hypothetical protein
MAFSYEAARDNDSVWLKEVLSEAVPTSDFVFYFSERPRDAGFCREILSEIGLAGLTPHIRVPTFRAHAV